MTNIKCPLRTTSLLALEDLCRASWKSGVIEGPPSHVKSQNADRVLLICDDGAIAISAIACDVAPKIEVFGVFASAVSEPPGHSFSDPRFAPFLGRRHQVRVVTRRYKHPDLDGNWISVDDGVVFRAPTGEELEIRADYDEPTSVVVAPPSVDHVTAIRVLQ